MALELLANNLRAAPTHTMQYSTQETLLTITDLVVHGGFSLQASALNALSALLPEMPFELIPLQAVVCSLLLTLETWHSSMSIPEGHPALQLWQQHVLTCLNLVTGMLGDAKGQTGPAESILEALPKLASCLDHSQIRFQARLCHVALDVAEQNPELCHHLAPMLPLLAVPGDSGKAASHAYYLIVRQLEHLQPQHPMFGLQVGFPYM